MEKSQSKPVFKKTKLKTGFNLHWKKPGSPPTPKPGVPNYKLNVLERTQDFLGIRCEEPGNTNKPDQGQSSTSLPVQKPQSEAIVKYKSNNHFSSFGSQTNKTCYQILKVVAQPPAQVSQLGWEVLKKSTLVEIC